MEVVADDKERIIDLAARYVCPARVETFRGLGVTPVMGRREGHYFWDLDGRKLFDVHINGGTYNLGHRNPELIATLRDALEQYDIGNHHLVSGPRTRLAEMLTRLTPGDLRYCVFTPSGNEAVEVALRTARKATGRRKIVSFRGGYHGHGGLALRASDTPLAQYFLSDDPPGEFVHVPFNDLEAVEAALRPRDAAAVICETIPATSGFPPPAPGFLSSVQQLCAAHGALYIADEVQTGLGRTGRMWAIEHYGVQPDVLVTAKGLSGGIYPIAAAVLSERVAGWLREEGWGYSSTGGGSELGCIVAAKVLEITQRPGVLENVRAMSARLARGLAEIQQRHPLLCEVRQNGLVMGLRFAHPQGGMMMMAAAYEVGLWAFFASFERSVLQFKPGLLIDERACDEVLDLLTEAIVRCELQHRPSPQ